MSQSFEGNASRKKCSAEDSTGWHGLYLRRAQKKKIVRKTRSFVASTAMTIRRLIGHGALGVSSS